MRTNTESSDIHDHKTNVKDSVKVNSGIKSVSDASNKDSSGSINEIDQASQGKTISLVFAENDKNHEEQSENKQQCEVTLNDEDTKRSQKNERPKSHESKVKDELQSESESLHNENNLNNKDSEIIPGNDDCLVSDENVENYQGQSNNEYPHDRKDLSSKGNRITLVGNDKALVNSDGEEKVKTQSKELQCKQEDLNDKVYVKVVQGKNDVMIKSTEKLVEQKGFLNDAEIEINESVEDSENKYQAQSHSQSKSKRQSKKEEKAKKKEEKLKKKQIKTKSEKTLKKGHGIKEKVTAKEGEVSELVSKEGNNRGVKLKPEKGKRMSSDEKATTSEVLDLERKGQSSQQQNGKMADAMAGDQGLKIVRECKDTLLRLSVSEDLEGSENENSAEEDWEKTWDDDGECLDANLLAEVRR